MGWFSRGGNDKGRDARPRTNAALRVIPIRGQVFPIRVQGPRDVLIQSVDDCKGSTLGCQGVCRVDLAYGVSRLAKSENWSRRRSSFERDLTSVLESAKGGTGRVVATHAMDPAPRRC